MPSSSRHDIVEMNFSTPYNSSAWDGDRKLPVKRVSRRKFGLTCDNNPVPILEYTMTGATLVPLFEPFRGIFSKVFSVSNACLQGLLFSLLLGKSLKDHQEPFSDYKRNKPSLGKVKYHLSIGQERVCHLVAKSSLTSNLSMSGSFVRVSRLCGGTFQRRWANWGRWIEINQPFLNGNRKEQAEKVAN